MDPTTMKYISIVSAVIFGSVLIFGLLYKVSQMDDTVSKKSKKYKLRIALGFTMFVFAKDTNETNYIVYASPTLGKLIKINARGTQ